MCFFFKQKTAYEMRISDWSSDVCSSDLRPHGRCVQFIERPGGVHLLANDIAGPSATFGIEHHGCEGGENIADAVAGVRWTAGRRRGGRRLHGRSEEHTSELQSLMRISYAVFCLTKTNQTKYCNVHIR